MRAPAPPLRSLAATCFLLAALPSASRAQAAPDSAPSDAAGPGARRSHAMTYDAARGEVLLFGGMREQGPDDALWGWNGERWRLLARGGPPARSHALFAFDARRGRAVLHGGQGADSVLRDTWEWDGRRWHRFDVEGPPKRAHAAMAWDARRARTIVFGGTQGEMPTRDPSRQFAGDDTWAWDGARWTPIAGPRPPGRKVHAMAWDERRGALLLVGGSAGRGQPTIGDMWELAADGWRRVEGTAGPWHSHTLVSMDEAGILAYGGGNGSEPNPPHAWRWSGREWSRLTGTGPPSIWLPSLAYDSARRRVVLHGGADDRGLLDGTWELDPATERWVRLPASGPPREAGR